MGAAPPSVVVVGSGLAGFGVLRELRRLSPEAKLTLVTIEDGHFDIAVIPKTWEMTDLSTLQAGDSVNLEADVIAKYVENILRYGGKQT